MSLDRIPEGQAKAKARRNQPSAGDMLDTTVGQSKKDDPTDVAKIGYEAMSRGDGDVVTGWQNKLRSAIANITPSGIVAEVHRGMAEPGSSGKPPR